MLTLRLGTFGPVVGLALGVCGKRDVRREDRYPGDVIPPSCSSVYWRFLLEQQVPPGANRWARRLFRGRKFAVQYFLFRSHHDNPHNDHHYYLMLPNI